MWFRVEMSRYSCRFPCRWKSFCVELCRLMSWVELNWSVKLLTAQCERVLAKLLNSHVWSYLQMWLPTWLTRIHLHTAFHLIPRLGLTRHLLTWWHILSLLVLLMLSTARWKSPRGHFRSYIDDTCCCTTSSQSTCGLLGDSSSILVRKILQNALLLNYFGFIVLSV